MELADVIRRHGPAYLAQFSARMPQRQLRALAAILRCHTPACGGSLYVCERCGHQHFAYHCCGHRACGQCGERQARAWRERQQERLLPVTYFLVTFTVPEELRRLLRQQPRVGYQMLFQESAAALQDLARQPRYLGGELGALGVLHTWSRQLVYHPHVHYLVPGVACRADGTLCFPKDPAYLLPVQRLSARFRSRFRARLQREWPEQYRQIPQRLWRRPWVVHCQANGRGSEALRYLSRYIYKTALSSTRLLRQDDHTVTFTYRDSQSGQERHCTLAAAEFLRRFLQHVLPKGFQRVRHYGWLAPAAQRRYTAVATLLNAPPPPLTQNCVRRVEFLCPHCQRPLQRMSGLGRAPP